MVETVLFGVEKIPVVGLESPLSEVTGVDVVEELGAPKIPDVGASFPVDETVLFGIEKIPVVGLESSLSEVTGVVFSTGNVEVGREEDTLNGEDCDCDIPEIEMLVVLITVGSLVLFAAGIKEKAVVAVEAKAGPAEVLDAAVVVAKGLEVPVGWNPEKPKLEG